MGARGNVASYVVFCAIALTVIACGPVEYINQVTRRAAAEVAAAKAAGAERYAPYEYTAAVEYLHKAREEGGYADFQVAVEFAKKAQDFAHQARDLARERAASTPEGIEALPQGGQPVFRPAAPGGGR